jgi:hypothetical protein
LTLSGDLLNQLVLGLNYDPTHDALLALTGDGHSMRSTAPAVRRCSTSVCAR